ncbi:Alcohol dehydrogenase [Ruminococcaceae bacterium BL-4]|nr:Alcohol dehydrogenase [Ruminococcaceae bacterium BL-4]
MAFCHFIPTKVLYGKGSLETLHEQKMPGRKALIVISAGISMKKYGYLKRVEEQLDKAGVMHVLFDRIQPNPIKAHVMEGAKLANAVGCDFVVGLGGGSSIDSAKAIAVMATNSGDYWQYVEGESLKKSPLPIVAIPTTAGTGTEADLWTVITNEKTQEKRGFGCDETYPKIAVVDSDLMMTVPPRYTAFQGFDALFHSTEGYLSNRADLFSDLYALKAIELIGKNLRTAVENGENEEARGNMALGSMISGFVESTAGCISEHSIEHALSAKHPDLPHGAGLIMISEAYYRQFCNKGCCDERLVQMAKALGNEKAEKPEDFVIALHELIEACHVDDLKMSGYGILKEDLHSLRVDAMGSMGGNFKKDPAPLSGDEVEAILEVSYR